MNILPNYLKLRSVVSKLSQKNDLLYYSLRRVNRWCIYLLGTISNRYRKVKYFSTLELSPEKILWINPNNINQCCMTSSNKYLDAGKILDGDWDRQIEPFEKYTEIMSAIRDTFIYGKSFQDSEFYKKAIKLINNGEIVAGCRSKADFDNRVVKIKDLFEDIKVNGFKEQSRLLENSKTDDLDRNDYITVHINRDGHFLFADGQHRLAIAKIFNVERVPVRVSIRHAKWIQFRQEILDVAKNSGGKIYQSLSHPDLIDIPTYHTDDRIKIILSGLPIRSGTMLDIGAHWGYFCDQFEKIGFDCFAVENDPVHLYFLTKLNIANNNRFTILPKSVFDVEKNDFDVVFAFNIFHHFLKTKSLYEKLLKFLGNIKTKHMFFEPHLQGEFINKGYYRNYDEEEFTDLILRNSCLRTKTFLGRAVDGRAIYRLDT